MAFFASFGFNFKKPRASGMMALSSDSASLVSLNGESGDSSPSPVSALKEASLGDQFCDLLTRREAASLSSESAGRELDVGLSKLAVVLVAEYMVKYGSAGETIEYVLNQLFCEGFKRAYSGLSADLACTKAVFWNNAVTTPKVEAAMLALRCGESPTSESGYVPPCVGVCAGVSV